MDINLKIGIRIRELRNQQQLSQEALANIAEVDRTYMTKVETGKRNVTVRILDKILHALGTDYKTFYSDKIFEP